MIWKKLTHIQSPVWHMVIYGLLLSTAYTTAYPVEDWLYWLIRAALAAAIGLYMWAMRRHKVHHPHSAITLATLLPIELKEEDEGMQRFTYRAVRRVYTLYAIAVPAGLLLMILFMPPSWLALLGIGALLYIHLGIYLVSIWPVLGEE